MYIYKFRVQVEEIEDYIRDIEISVNQTFEDFHNSIIECNGLDGKELASFFICDSKWRKQRELTLMDMGVEEISADIAQYDDEDYEDLNKSIKVPRTLMKKSAINQYIDDPHQYIIYMYDYINPKIFYIELIKTTEAQSGTNYPRCTLSEGKLPDNKKNNFPILGTIGDEDFDNIDDVDEEELLIDDIDDLSEEVNEEESGFENDNPDFDNEKF